MSGPDLTSIPLPMDSGSKGGVKKTAKEMLQEALKDHKLSSKKDLNTSTKQTSNKLATALGPKIKMTGNTEKAESSQSIVDELFKDFIAQKFSTTSKDTVAASQEGTVSQGGSLDELSKILDMEISSIQSHTDSKDTVMGGEKLLSNSHNYHKSKSSSKRSRSRFSSDSSEEKRLRTECVKLEQPITEKDLSSSSSQLFTLQNCQSHSGEENQQLPENTITCATSKTPTLPVLSSVSVNSASILDNKTICDKVKLPEAVVVPITTAPQPSNTLNSAAITTALAPKPNVMLPLALAKKFGPPKLLGVKLSSESLSLIKSTDRIDRDGRVWEEGELHSEESEKDILESDSELDSCPSETGSVNSNIGDWKSQSFKRKKKHKHKHKKKKKKSSKEKDESKDKHKDSSKGKDKKNRDRSNSKDDKDRKNSAERDQKKEKGRDKSEERPRRDSEKHSSRDRSREKSLDRKHEGTKKRENEADSKKKRSHSSRYSEWDARRYSDDPSSKDRSRSRSLSKGRSSDKHKRPRNKSRSKERDQDKEKHEGDLRLQIDKAKLRKIAMKTPEEIQGSGTGRKFSLDEKIIFIARGKKSNLILRITHREANALQNMKSGQGPQVDLTALKSGGKSVQELTEFCKRISENSKTKHGSESSNSSDEDTTRQSDDEDLLIHHPFKIKDTNSSNIVMNIRNAKQLPVLTPSEKQAQQAALRLTFPVSSGSHHRANESEWVPVEKVTAVSTVAVSSAIVSQATIEAPPPPVEVKKSESIFPDPAEAQKIDIGTIISERLQAVRKLQENPYDVQALSKMHQVQEKASMWATSKHLPGQFMGSTGAHVLSQEELIGDKKHQAWAKRTQLSQAAPVNGGIGMFLLQKMGWKQGEGLGKNNEGSKVPLMLDIKIDRKGLTTATENSRNKTGLNTAHRAKDLSNKHPVSALMELCNRRRWGPPVFTVIAESGPDHKKNFLFKVKVNNVEYQPCVLSTNKKTAKAQCAAVCLQEMGLIPRDAPLNV